MSTIQAIFSGLRIAGFAPILPASSHREIVTVIHANRSVLAGVSEIELATRAAALRTQAVAGIPIATLAGEAFALLDEAANRTLGIRFYDVQFTAAFAMLGNQIAEMKTGEGKTFVGALTALVQSLRGRGVHFMTTNAYLAERDHEIVSRMFQLLGFSVGLINRAASPQEKCAAYRCDVTYGPGYEFGFDYLRDQVALLGRRKPKLGEQFQMQQRGQQDRSAAKLQREHYVAIVDEADSVMLDDATTPLILSSSPDRDNPFPEAYQLADSVAEQLISDEHYRIDSENRRVLMTAAGQHQSQLQLAKATRGQLCRPWTRYVENALAAHHLFTRDAQYIVVDTQIRIVDSSTGRVFEDRSWSDGLHQAVEAKEGVTITEENSSLARITRQQYFRLYEHLCGMTGTAVDGQRELRQVYGLPVTVIPTHKPCQRIAKPTRFFTTEAAKFDAIAKCVHQIHRTGQPILVGTRTIERSEAIAGRLEGLAFQMLNGKQDADEANLIAQAGQRGAVTIATNMAGRGTDIKLADGVAALGGLFVIVSEPHESVRVDRQLVGRAARQGDPGEFQSFVSSEDELITQHAPWLARYIQRIAGADGEIAVDLKQEIIRLQKRVERKTAATRRQMFSREHWLEDTLAKLAKV